MSQARPRPPEAGEVSRDRPRSPHRGRPCRHLISGFEPPELGGSPFQLFSPAAWTLSRQPQDANPPAFSTHLRDGACAPTLACTPLLAPGSPFAYSLLSRTLLLTMPSPTTLTPPRAGLSNARRRDMEAPGPVPAALWSWVLHVTRCHTPGPEKHLSE